MAQNTRTTNDVIINSLYLIGELGVGETPDGFMLTTGLDLINELLDKFSSDSIYIPYLTTLNFTLIPGKDTYSISDIITGTDIVADRVVDLSFANYTVPGYPTAIAPPSSSFITNFAFNSQLILDSAANLPTGTPVTLTVTGNETFSAPLAAGVTYYAIFVDLNHVYLATTLANALAGIHIQLTSDGTGTGMQIIYSSVSTTPTQPTVTNIIYPIRIITKSEYYGVVRQGGLIARPGFVFLNKQDVESFVTFYPAPDQPYPCTLQVKSMINSLGAFDDLTELPPYYYGFLKYALARKFMGYYPSGNWPAANEDEYQDYYNNLKNANETDLTIRPSVTMTAPEPFYWPNILSY
jgi:hypothetical protein